MNDIDINIELVVTGERVRKDFGNIDELCDSIKAVGLIQPIVLNRDLRLIAGERRLRALQRIGVTTLIHASHFIWKDELDDVKIKAMECEENLKRKAFTWQEEVLAKKRLLELMQTIHGTVTSGRPSRSDALGITSPGFGINKLASLLGESNAQTSKDIELANLIEAVPQLARAETKEAARRSASLAMAVAGALQQQAKNLPKTEQKWTLFEGDFVNNVNSIETDSVDLVICDPPYGAGTSGKGPNSKDLLATPFADSSSDVSILDLLVASQRILKPNSFAVFFFDFIYYTEWRLNAPLYNFELDVTPLIWVKNTVINTSPYVRYGRSYEPILILRKGEPKLMRPSQRDVLAFDNVITRGTNEHKVYQAQKPIALIEKLILDMSPPGSTVVDFCAGSGTTGEAALKQGRRTFLFEKDPIACQIIRARLGAL